MGPLPSSVYLDIIHVIKWTRPVLHATNDQKLDSGKAWEQGYSFLDNLPPVSCLLEEGTHSGHYILSDSNSGMIQIYSIKIEKPVRLAGLVLVSSF